jgi:hypothetical protein
MHWHRKVNPVTDMALSNTYPVIVKTCPDENLAVDSARGKVYIPVELRDPDFYNDPHSMDSLDGYYALRHSSAVLEVDWKSGNKHLLSTPGFYDRVISLPNVVGVEDGESIAIYRQNGSERDSEREAGRCWPLLRFADARPNKFYANETEPADYYYVPDLGLFESREILNEGYVLAASLEFQLTDRNLSTNHINPLQITITNSPGHAFDYDGRFFVRNINGKPHWI